MSIDILYGFVLFLNLVRHGISVPLAPNYYNYYGANYQDVPGNDVTGLSSSERFPRNTIGSQYNVPGHQWVPRSQINHRPTQLHKRHFHLFHLTAKHPNAVSYHVIEKSPVHRTISAPSHEQHHQSTYDQYNNNYGQYSSPSSYYQQPTTYNQQGVTYPSYPSYPSYPNNDQSKPVDTTYQDILQEVSNPMRFSGEPAPYGTNPQATELRDDFVDTLGAAAKQFNTISADMNNMELASLVMFPFPHRGRHSTKKKRFHKKHGKKLHKKISHVVNNNNKKTKHQHKLRDTKTTTSKALMNQLINEKDDDDKEKDDDKEYEDNGSSSGDSWDEEDLSTSDATSKRSKIPHAPVTTSISEKSGTSPELTTDDGGFFSTKRSEIPHVFDKLSDSDDNEDISSTSAVRNDDSSNNNDDDTHRNQDGNEAHNTQQ